MKLGKGPTSLLDRHSIIYNITALRHRSDIFESYETVSFPQHCDSMTLVETTKVENRSLIGTTNGVLYA